jgi:TldD protein
MTLSRRQFVTRLSAATAMTAVGSRASAALGFPLGLPADATTRRIPSDRADASFVDPDRLRIIAMSAIDAARAAGASFADVRLTRTIAQSGGEIHVISPDAFPDEELLTIGVRALVDGYWGFAASPYWDVDEAAQLAKDAVAQARYNAKTGGRRVDLGTPEVVTGTWVMPVEIDPFDVSIEEKKEWLTARVEDYHRYRARRRNLSSVRCNIEFTRQERVVANTEGSYFTQVVYRSGGELVIGVGSHTGTAAQQMPIPGFTLSGAGWELFQRPVWDRILESVAEGEALNAVPIKPLDVGRYDVVFDAQTTAALLDRTLGPATELDRVMGYEANADGTSFLGPDPMDVLGTFQLASRFVNVTANRTETSGLATVQWDDEGIAGHQFPLVRDGILTDFQTTRESAAWIAPWYTQRRTPVRSHGCAASESADTITMQHRPNLVLEPATSDVSLDDLIKHVKKGIFLSNADVHADFQLRTGLGEGTAREIVDGKLGAFIAPAAFSFDTLALWKNVIGVGGRGTEVRIAGKSVKGEPAQATYHSVTAVPMAATGIAVIDPLRKA